MTTFRRADWEAAQAAWDDFSPEWHAMRQRAMRRGILYPPAGSKWDSWEDDRPTQRAILIRAIRETPTLLAQCIDQSRSWSDVVGRLVRARDAARRAASALDGQSRTSGEGDAE